MAVSAVETLDIIFGPASNGSFTGGTPVLPSVSLRGSNITAEEGVDAALAFVEAGPSAGAFVFAVACGAGSGLAADGAVAACGEGVHGEVVFFDVVLDLVTAPGGHGVELHDVEVAEDIEVVEFDDPGFLA